MALDAAHRLKLAAADALAIAACCELLHNASLVHDDVQDGDRTRRGHPAVWAVFGSDVAICTGDAMVSAAYASLADVSRTEAIPALLRRTHNAVARTIVGQAGDLAALSTNSMSVAAYEDIAAAKSGPLLALPLTLPLLLCGETEAARQADVAARHFAIGYQVADDLEDDDVDRGSAGRKACLNIIGVLEPAMHASARQDAFRVAAGRARGHLERASRLAADLPCDCGAALSGHVRRLMQRLEPWT